MSVSETRAGPSRRGFFQMSASAAAMAPTVLAMAEPEAAGAGPATDDPRAPLEVVLTVNGRERRMQLDARTTLLDALRHHAGLTGTKKGCDHGQCGACTVHVGGKRVLACLTLAAMVREPVTTIEGLEGPDGTLHPMQEAFVAHDAFQCGYCTPGQIMSAVACVAEGHAGSDEEIREYMSGNLCRCAAYPHIVAAVADAKTRMEG